MKLFWPRTCVHASTRTRMMRRSCARPHAAPRARVCKPKCCAALETHRVAVKINCGDKWVQYVLPLLRACVCCDERTGRPASVLLVSLCGRMHVQRSCTPEVSARRWCNIVSTWMRWRYLETLMGLRYLDKDLNRGTAGCLLSTCTYLRMLL